MGGALSPIKGGSFLGPTGNVESPRDWFREQEIKAMQRLGGVFQNGQYYAWRDDFIAIEARTFFGSSGGSGGVAKARAELILTPGGGAGTNFQEVFWDDGTAPDLALPAGTTGNWAIYGRLRFTNVDANTRSHFGVRNASGNRFVRIGAIGAVSAANYVLQTDNGNINSNLPFDANMHDFMGVRTGGVTTFYIDDVARGSANVFPTIEPTGFHAIGLGTATVDSRIGLSAVGALFAQASP